MKGKRKRSSGKRRSVKTVRGPSKRETVLPKTLQGSLKVHREGYGFVLPEDPSEPDVFVPPRKMAGAMDGDKVRVSVWSRGMGGRFEGQVEEILQRGRSWLVGTLKKEGKSYLVEVQTGKPFLLFRVDREELVGAKLGDTVGIEILEYPEDKRKGRARVIQLFGSRGEESTEVDIIILKHQLPREFSPVTLREAEQISRQRSIVPVEGRKDLRQLHLVTIDGETARDFDDAICVQKEGQAYRLWVSIADVSHYVRPDSALDKEAFSRGTSVYFPDKVLPMLPEELSNDLCSLRPHEDRFSFTAELLFDGKGELKKSAFYKSIMRSQTRLTYRQVARAILKKEEETREKISAHLSMLQTAFELFQLLRARRMARGSIDFDLPEPEFIIDLEEGDIESIVKTERNEIHMLIEEFMVAANEAVATFITDQKHPSLYRVHARPDPEKIKSFQALLHNLGFDIRLPDLPSPKDLAKLLKRVTGHPEEKLIQHLLLRSMKQAVYAPKNEGHFGLASSCYTHFTSPIRRYPDLVVHRILEKVLLRKKHSAKQAQAELNRLTPIAGHSSRRERLAMQAEWEAVDLKVALFMKKFLGQSFAGVVSRVAKFGIFVELMDFFVEGLILREDLGKDFFVFDETRHRFQGKRSKRTFKIGTELQVTVSRVDVEERKVYFVLV